MPVFSYYKNKALSLHIKIPRDTETLTCGVFQVCTNKFCNECYKEGHQPSFSRKASPKATLELRKKNGNVIVCKHNKSALWTFDMKKRHSSLMYVLKCFLKDCNSNKSFCSICSRKLSCVVEAQFSGVDVEPFVSQVYFVQSSPQKKKRQREELSETDESPTKRSRDDDLATIRADFNEFKFWVQDAFQKIFPAIYKHRLFALQTQDKLQDIERRLREEYQPSSFPFSDFLEPLFVESVDSTSDVDISRWEEVEKDIESLFDSSPDTSAQKSS